MTNTPRLRLTNQAEVDNDGTAEDSLPAGYSTVDMSRIDLGLAPNIGADPAATRPRAAFTQRLYHVECLREDGRIVTLKRRLPTDPFLEAAFTAVARGTLVATDDGPIAVEDLRPGMRLDTAEAGAMVLHWIGRIRVEPDIGLTDQPNRCLTRVMMDSLGFNRPMLDMLVGPGAQLWSARDKQFCAPDQLQDDECFIGMRPIVPMDLYHLCLAGGPTIMANGVAMQSYQPDADQLRRQKPERLAHFADLFPNAALLDEFGIEPANKSRRYPKLRRRNAVA